MGKLSQSALPGAWNGDNDSQKQQIMSATREDRPGRPGRIGQLERNIADAENDANDGSTMCGRGSSTVPRCVACLEQKLKARKA